MTDRLSGVGAMVVTVVAVGLTAGLVLLSFGGLIAMVAAVVVAVLVCLIAALGSARVGTIIVMAAVATAPMYKGLAPSDDATVTPTDALFVLGFLLLLPVLLRGRIHLPVSYAGGAFVIVMAGAVSTVASDQKVLSGLALVLWLMVLIGLPVVLGLWGPSPRVVDLLAWSYVTGQLVSQGLGVVLGRVDGDGRHYGYTNHPNYFGQAAVMAFALLLYLYGRHTGQLYRLVVVGAGLVCSLSVVLSGSRGALLVLIVLVLMVPFVERSAAAGLLWTLGGALALLSIPLILSFAGDAPAIDRLTGNASSAGSDQIRSAGLRAGVARFWDHPIFGSGLVDLFEIHNNYLEIAVGVGALGLLGYLAVMYTFAGPLFGRHELRRLCYPVWGYLAWGAFVPGLYDRSIWAAVAISAVVVFSRNGADGSSEDTTRSVGSAGSGGVLRSALNDAGGRRS